MLGYSRIPELPRWLQPSGWRDGINRSSKAPEPAQGRFDFHATAQAILLLTILTEPQ